MTPRQPVQFEAELVEIRSRPDHSYDIRLNVPEYAIDAVRAMLPWVHDAVGVAIVNLTDDGIDGKESDARPRRTRAVRKG